MKLGVLSFRGPALAVSVVVAVALTAASADANVRAAESPECARSTGRRPIWSKKSSGSPCNGGRSRCER